MNANTKKLMKNLALCTILSLPAFASAETEVFTEIASDIEKLETGIKVVGSAIIGVTIVGTSYIVGKRWIKRV